MWDSVIVPGSNGGLERISGYSGIFSGIGSYLRGGMMLGYGSESYVLMLTGNTQNDSVRAVPVSSAGSALEIQASKIRGLTNLTGKATGVAGSYFYMLVRQGTDDQMRSIPVTGVNSAATGNPDAGSHLRVLCVYAGSGSQGAFIGLGPKIALTGAGLAGW
jgi:hypothetical protein